jgi:hypothetical protein
MVILVSEASNRYTHLFVVEREYFGFNINIAIFRMCYEENGTVKFLETLADNVFRHNYSMM